MSIEHELPHRELFFLIFALGIYDGTVPCFLSKRQSGESTLVMAQHKIEAQSEHSYFFSNACIKDLHSMTRMVPHQLVGKVLQ